jgi:hypothetical protein
LYAFRGGRGGARCQAGSKSIEGIAYGLQSFRPLRD